MAGRALAQAVQDIGLERWPAKLEQFHRMAAQADRTGSAGPSHPEPTPPPAPAPPPAQPAAYGHPSAWHRNMAETDTKLLTLASAIAADADAVAGAAARAAGAVIIGTILGTPVWAVAIGVMLLLLAGDSAQIDLPEGMTIKPGMNPGEVVIQTKTGETLVVHQDENGRLVDAHGIVVGVRHNGAILLKPDEIDAAILQSRPRGYWPGDKGAEEWGKRNGISSKGAKKMFHGLKEDLKIYGASDNLWVDPETGDVVDENGNHVGNLNDQERSGNAKRGKSR